MNINDIVEYCNSKYKKNNPKYRCENCENHCQGSCEKCLDTIHFGNNRRYNCENISNYYCCKYIYKYSSEIQHLFEAHHTLLELNCMRVVSVGCGPCTDLFGILNFLENNSLDIELEYTGIDLNNIWENVHNLISIKNNDNFTTRFIYDDIFNIVQSDLFKNKIKPNIMIFQYVLSDMKKYNSDVEIKAFIDKFIKEIVINLEDNSYIIFNDINHRDTRQYFEYMLKQMKENNIEIQSQKHHFNNNVRGYHYDYGVEYEYNNITTDIIDEVLNTYNPWEFCSSAQLIIRKKVL